MATMRAVTLDTTGQVLCWGYSDLVAAAGQTQHTITGPQAPPAEDKYTKVIAGVFTAMSAAEKTAVDDRIAATLEAAKVIRRREVNQRTGELVDAGFTFDDGNGDKTYSMSLNAQSRAEGVYQLQSNPLFTWPVDWPTSDDAYYASFADWAAFEPFHLAMAAALRVVVGSAKSLREAISAAATFAELAAVVDER